MSYNRQQEHKAREAKKRKYAQKQQSRKLKRMRLIKTNE